MPDDTDDRFHFTDPIDLGQGNSVEINWHFCGMRWHHMRPDTGGQCDALGWVNWDGPESWILESREPLTLSPSLLCRRCGRHGFVRDGRWVPA